MSFRQSLDWEGFTLDGEAAYAAWVGRSWLQAFFTQTVWVRTIWSWSIQDVRGDTALLRGGEALMGWEKDPGRGLYLGGRVDLPEARADPVAWTVSAKASWVFSL